MEQSFDDLLNGAFSDDDVVTEVSVGFLENEDLDFENMNSDDKFEEDKTNIPQVNLPTKEDGALHQEAMGGATVLTKTQNKDMYVAENDDDEEGTDDKNSEEDSQGVRISVMSMDQTPQEGFTSSDTESEEESSDSVTDEEDMGTGEQPGDLLMSVHCSDELCNDNKEDKFFAEGQPLALEGTEAPEVRNEQQVESEMDEEMSYFGPVPEHAREMMMKGDGTEEDEEEREAETQEESSDSECEHVKIRQEEKVNPLCSGQEVKSPYKVEDRLEFLEISAQNLRDLVAETDTEEYVEKMKDFSGEEHQEAGESFADYPSDFSSYEYVESGGQNQGKDYKANPLSCMERAATDIAWTRRREEDADQEGEGSLYSRDSEMDADGVMNLDVATEENGNTKIETMEFGCDDGDQAAESDSYSSSSDDVQEGREGELSDNMHLENYNKLEDTQLYSERVAAFFGSSISDDHQFTNDQMNVADLKINWDFNFPSLLCEDLLNTEDTDAVETQPTDVSGHPAEDINNYSVVQREDSKTTCISYQGSLDDGFFFNTELEASGVSELGQLGDDEYEEERNWEQEKERIKAFYKFYDDNVEEDGREERRTKVQFCADPLSQVIHYETDSSDRDSLSSSTEGEEDLSSAETSEEPREPDDTLQIEPAYDPQNIELSDNTQENNVSNTQICTRKHKSVGMLKQILKMALVVLMGSLMFWLATDQADWLGQISFF